MRNDYGPPNIGEQEKWWPPISEVEEGAKTRSCLIWEYSETPGGRKYRKCGDCADAAGGRVRRRKNQKKLYNIKPVEGAYYLTPEYTEAKGFRGVLNASFIFPQEVTELLRRDLALRRGGMAVVVLVAIASYRRGEGET